MKSREVVQVFRNTIISTKKAGVERVSVADLEAYVTHLDNVVAETGEDVQAGKAAMERYRADLSAWISSRQQKHEHNLEMLRAVVATGQSALRSALLINGGAAVAMLAFIGGIWPHNSSSPVIGSLAFALVFYVFGVLAAAVASGATYFSQAGYGQEFGSASDIVGRVGHILAVLGVFIAYGLFGYASWSAFLAISSC